MATLCEIKEAIRCKRADGGYPLYLICGDGEPLSIDAARANFREIADAHIRRDERSCWFIVGVDINYEDDLVCAHSGDPIERAYPADCQE